MYILFFKRFFDILFSGFLLTILIIPFILTAIFIKMSSKGPIFFNQVRIGKDGIRFKIFKFRTMIHKKRVVNNEILLNNPEIIFGGKLLRRFKIDELPQLFNILIGDMSFVGPRPCTPELLQKFNETAFFRLKVRPGLTGLAQTKGNIYLTWEERWLFDKKYVLALSFLEDLKIFLKTFFVLIFGEKIFLKR